MKLADYPRQQFVLIVVDGILYMRVQIGVIATVIIGCFAAIFLITNEVGFSPLYVPLSNSTIRIQ
jgi:hypothetical protein